MGFQWECCPKHTAKRMYEKEAHNCIEGKKTQDQTRQV